MTGVQTCALPISSGLQWYSHPLGLLVFGDLPINTTGIVATKDISGTDVSGGANWNLKTLVYRIDHGLGVVPKVVRVVAVCITADTTVSATLCPAGTEIPIESLVESAGGGPNYTVSVTNQYIYVSAFTNIQGEIRLTKTAGGSSRVNITVANWQIKAYAWI